MARGLLSELVQVADITGLDLVAIQDHAYNHTFLDTWTLIAFLAAKTSHIHFMPDVADLPLRPPPMLAKAVATLDRLTDGRAELAIGAGAFWDAIAGNGWSATRSRRSPWLRPPRRWRSSVMRLRVPVTWSRMDNTTWCLATTRPASGARHPTLVGAVKPRMLQLIGRRAGGWVSPLNIYTPPDEVPRSRPLSMVLPARLVAIRPRFAVCTTSLARSARGVQARVCMVRSSSGLRP